MTQSNPIQWARMPAQKSEFTGEIHRQNSICEMLAEIFVNKMGVAKGVSLEVDPSTGSKVFHFRVDRSSPIPNTLVSEKINGIPVRYTVEEAR